jgi:plasmid maintenance system antidote protein VapI
MKSKNQKLYPCDFNWEPIPPGRILTEMLEQNNISIALFAAKLACSMEQAESFIRGELPVTSDIAKLLEQLVGTSAECWEKLEAGYQKRKIDWAAKQQLNSAAAKKTGSNLAVSG